MKKTYIIPTTTIVTVNIEKMIALSGGGNATDNLSQDDEGDVKGSSSSRYNVWDDDWSAE